MGGKIVTEEESLPRPDLGQGQRYYYLQRSPGGGHGDLLRYSCLENSMDRGAWWAIFHRVAESDTIEVT